MSKKYSKKTILVITSSVDKTVDYLIENYSLESSFFRFDIDFFENYLVDISEQDWKIRNVITNQEITKKITKSIYYRKPNFPNLDDYEEKYHQLIQRDIYSVICGIADGFSGVVLSKPFLLHRADNKVSQLQVAQNIGFQVPKSYIGNNQRFCDEFSGRLSIIKPLSLSVVGKNKDVEIYQTNIFRYENEDIKKTPVYLQEYVSKNFEVRLTVINNVFYPVRIDTKNKVDWRKDYENHKYQLIKMPTKIETLCKKFMKYYNLKFGAFDFIINKRGDWIFLEMNSNGQWLWLEKNLKLDISEKIITMLRGKR